MIINDAGRRLIMENEGCKLTAYRCPADVWTIGYGHTGESVKEGLTITQHQADVILESDLQRFEYAVSKTCPRANANQFSAMVCLCFNIGVDAFQRSTLARKFVTGDTAGAAWEFCRWTRAKGVELPGLVKRRKQEQTLFLTVPS